MANYKVLSIVVLLFLAVITYYIYDRYIKRDPIRIIEQVYDIDLDRFDCTVELFKEQWLPNGDGFCQIILNMNTFPTNSDFYLKSKKLKAVPIVINSMSRYSAGKEFEKYLNIKKGYYLYKSEDKYGASFNLLIFDLENNKIIYRCELI